MAKILIIEDQKELCRLYWFALTQAGHDIRLAYTGEDGVDQAMADRPDLVILDLGLPGISGAEVAQKLWDSGVLPKAPLIIATAYGNEGKLLAEQFDAAGVLIKPFNISFLVAAVGCALNGHSQSADVKSPTDIGV